ncbi:MAG: preprotein translocase subunit SecY [Candidatus Taylorbacteria bacterium RIFCSPLOWO2_12_FULL_43_20]|uniref:Protein translocase subunit SecY n=1 Tax=Candidatus Taylorbacteria bacterium RIFCSPLOWO2_12_FULL_43_20 TaxID=1802332 RepID=A0A1G2P2C3_9BACT|nr:MAG: preprotein translocase subunit SecY [Candidatus Taylorbacteria bacterium RIFCSPHIGHO2_01_FULL_43_120]OHA23463.1 MAG: preprotein translocase subunit SecY [Candidatus Taylorbacteria bacterium RIFCSPHIGHO2_02_FULL_43_55]OHA29691.1 MAG: preprotein translocase subunit SecY [Candidatus Taylorbacteria bacterium RIFCSPHIGHO2_12_FULL_42_34]OHA31596.1 MAG: preprotein translocase subunit SecY [Candidatus Taylorbacteria bacterium RIFCSPLOWO2_01_FULL_43_83]OHA38999.1 MAG: preprotein translocase subu
MFDKISFILKDHVLRRKLLFVFLGLVLFRVMAAIPIPGVDPVRLESFFANNQFFGLLNIFSGSGLATLSIVMLGVGPYITASIIMQLLTMMSSKLKALYHEEGEAGRMRFTQYSRRISVILAAIQAYGFLILLERQGIIDALAPFDLVTNIFVITGGSVLLMWLGELITEYGIGNGVSLIIFGGIVAGLPQTLNRLIFTFDPSRIPLYVMSLVVAVVIVWAVVVITEGERPIPVTYAKRVRGSKMYGGVSTYLPLRVNQAGVIPIIFALSILLFPQMILNFLVNTTNPQIVSFAERGLAVLSNSWIYGIGYFILVFVFTYFYTAVTFDPHTISTNLQKNGAFIPGVRPGQSTSSHLARVVTRITLVGAIFLAFIAVLPLIMQGVTGDPSLAIGGTALLIAVSVVLDFAKKIEGQVSMREY